MVDIQGTYISFGTKSKIKFWKITCLHMVKILKSKNKNLNFGSKKPF